MSKYDDELKIETKFVIPHNIAEIYSQEHRSYHDLDHIYYMLNMIPMLTRGILPPKAIEPLAWAVMYHDAVYNVPDPDKRNEELSAELFLQDHADNYFAEQIVQAILSTKTHILSLSEANVIDLFLVDLDLWALGDKNLYEFNSLRLQAEFNLSDEEWVVGRGAWLESFLERDRIYYTPRGATREAEARKVLEDDLASLRK